MLLTESKMINRKHSKDGGRVIFDYLFVLIVLLLLLFFCFILFSVVLLCVYFEGGHAKIYI